MTNLQKNALASPPLSQENVELLYRGFVVNGVPRLCESHERLRAELAGAEAMWADAERELAEAKVEIERLMRGV